jgi:hypothetical protein
MNTPHMAIDCAYSISVRSDLTVASDPDHPDSIRGTLTYHANGYGEIVSNGMRFTADCLSTFGQPATMVEDGTIDITGVSEEDAKTHIILMTGQVKDCGRVCNGYAQPPSAFAAAIINPNHLAFYLRRGDDSELEVAGFSPFLGDPGPVLKERSEHAASQICP